MAKLGVGLFVTLLTIVVVFVVLTTALADTATDVGGASGNLTEEALSNGTCVSGGSCAGDVLPLTSFFKAKGVVLLAFMAGLAIMLIKVVLPKGK